MEDVKIPSPSAAILSPPAGQTPTIAQPKPATQQKRKSIVLKETPVKEAKLTITTTALPKPKQSKSRNGVSVRS